MVGGQAGGSVLPVPISRSRMVGEQAGTLGHVWPIANTVSFPLFVLSSSAGGRGWGIEEKEYPNGHIYYISLWIHISFSMHECA